MLLQSQKFCEGSGFCKNFGGVALQIFRNTKKGSRAQLKNASPNNSLTHSLGSTTNAVVWMPLHIFRNRGGKVMKQLHFWGCNMKKAFMYRAVEPARSDGGRATQSTASLLAALCFLLGIAFAAFAPVSPEGRFLVFCFAFAVAIGFYMGGHVLCQAFKLSDKLSGIIEARCAKLLAHFAGERLNRHVKNLQTQLNESELELKHLRSEIESAARPKPIYAAPSPKSIAAPTHHPKPQA